MEHLIKQRNEQAAKCFSFSMLTIATVCAGGYFAARTIESWYAASSANHMIRETLSELVKSTFELEETG